MRLRVRIGRYSFRQFGLLPIVPAPSLLRGASILLCAACLAALTLGQAPALAAIPAHAAEYLPAPSVPHEMPQSESEPTGPSQDRKAPARRATRRLLRFFGLASRREVEALRAEHLRLTEELQRTRRILHDHRAQSDSDLTAPEQERSHRTIALMRDQLKRVKAEIAFRTGHWRRAAAAPDALGFDGPSLVAPNPLPPGPYYEKSYRERFEVSGLEAHRACWLEISCLTRLQKLAPHLAVHFPAPVALDPATPCLTMTHAGWSLDIVPDDLRAEIAARLAPRIGEQTARITAALKAARVIHLDTHESGRNLAVDARGHVSLIDFDIAAIGNHAISAPIAERLDRWRARGGYQITAMRIAGQLNRFCADAGKGAPLEI